MSFCLLFGIQASSYKAAKIVTEPSASMPYLLEPIYLSCVGVHPHSPTIPWPLHAVTALPGCAGRRKALAAMYSLCRLCCVFLSWLPYDVGLLLCVFKMKFTGNLTYRYYYGTLKTSIYKTFLRGGRVGNPPRQHHQIARSTALQYWGNWVLFGRCSSATRS